MKKEELTKSRIVKDLGAYPTFNPLIFLWATLIGSFGFMTWYTIAMSITKRYRLGLGIAMLIIGITIIIWLYISSRKNEHNYILHVQRGEYNIFSGVFLEKYYDEIKKWLWVFDVDGATLCIPEKYMPNVPCIVNAEYWIIEVARDSLRNRLYLAYPVTQFNIRLL